MTKDTGVTVDRERCMGNGACAFQAPDVFAVVNGQARVLRHADASEEAVVNAVADCPAMALRLAGVTH